MGVDGGKKESLHIFRYSTEEQDRPIRSVKRGVLAWLRDWHDNGCLQNRQDVTESLKSTAKHSIALDPRCFRWKMQILISLVTWSVVNVTADLSRY